MENDGWKTTFLLGWHIFRGYVKLPGSRGPLVRSHSKCLTENCKVSSFVVAGSQLARKLGIPDRILQVSHNPTRSVVFFLQRNLRGFTENKTGESGELMKVV